MRFDASSPARRKCTDSGRKRPLCTSSSRVHRTFTGRFASLESSTESTTNSSSRCPRRPKPPPSRVRCSFTLSAGMPSALATAATAMVCDYSYHAQMERLHLRVVAVIADELALDHLRRLLHRAWGVARRVPGLARAAQVARRRGIDRNRLIAVVAEGPRAAVPGDLQRVLRVERRPGRLRDHAHAEGHARD